jgi:uncharacterized protein
MDHVFAWLGERLVACASGALWWPEPRLLCVSDLHLGRSERLARRGGGLLPPYESLETLERLAAEVARWRPARVVCLGDSFDDAACEAALGREARGLLGALMRRCEWVWIAGNHDPGPLGLGGMQVPVLEFGPFSFRHVPQEDPERGEVAGHVHPKYRRRIGGRMISRACFLLDRRRMILPAFGTYTGGVSADDPGVRTLLDDETARAILTGSPAIALPIAPTAQRRKQRA